MTGIDISAAPTVIARLAPNPVPALLLGRLRCRPSVFKSWSGTALVAHALATAAELNESVACRAVVVTALTEPTFEHGGNDLAFIASMQPIRSTLYLLTSEIVKTLRQLRTGLNLADRVRRGGRQRPR